MKLTQAECLDLFVTGRYALDAAMVAYYVPDDDYLAATCTREFARLYEIVEKIQAARMARSSDIANAIASALFVEAPIDFEVTCVDPGRERFGSDHGL
jgi:hypothetical protein